MNEERAANTGPREWDADTYDRVSDPQFEWGVEVLERLELDGNETVIDAGCGSGRVTERLLERLPNGRVIGVDASESMVEHARERFASDDRATVFACDLLELTPQVLAERAGVENADVVFSTATFHWVMDHDLLFSRIHAVLRPGGRLLAQCGGEGNVVEHANAIATVALREPYLEYFEGMDLLWNFAAPDETEDRLHRAGFDPVSCWLQDKPVQPEDPYAFTTTVTLGPHLTRLPEDLRRPFAEAVLEIESDPLVLNYVRLNIDAVSGPGQP